MRPATLHVLGIVAAVHVTVGLPAAAGQAAARDAACALIDTAEVMRLTGRKPYDGKGPKANDAGDLPTTDRGCHFVDVQFVLTTPTTRESFASTRKVYEAAGAPRKLQSVSGLGDEAYLMWDSSPGNYRSVLVVFRSGNKKVAIENQVRSDSVEATKKALLAIAKNVVPRLK